MTAPLTLDDATQFTREVLWRGELVLLVTTKYARGWQVVMHRSLDGPSLWSPVGRSIFPTAQAALDAAMGTPQITEAS